MRYLLFLSFLFTTIFGYSQMAGDVTEDKIIDANDFLFLKKTILEEGGYLKSADFDLDDKLTVTDLVLLYNYLYKNGTSLNSIAVANNESSATLTFGQYNPKKQTLELILKSKNLKAFQFEIKNIGEIKLIGEHNNVFISSNRLIGISFETEYFDEEMIFQLSLPKGITDEYCIDDAIFIDELANNHLLELGDCANPYWSEEGLEKVKINIINNNFDVASDIDQNGTVDIKDYLVLFDYLRENGATPPGKYVENNARVKMELLNNVIEDGVFELMITGDEKIAAFDFKLYGMDTILGIECNEIDKENFQFFGNRIIYFGDTKQGASKKIKLILSHHKMNKAEKICITSPVFLSSNNQHFNVKTGRCMDLKPIIYGCMDRKALNFNSNSMVDDGSCKYPEVKEVIVKVKEDKPIKEKDTKEEKVIVKKNTTKKAKENDKAENDKKLLAEERELAKQLKQDEKEAIKAAKDKKKEEDILAKKKAKEKLEEEKKVALAKLSLNKIQTTVKVLSLTSDQLKLIDDAVDGQMVYNINTKEFLLFNGEKWTSIKVNTESTIK